MNRLAKALMFAAATTALSSAANATVTLVMGDNSLTTQIHLDPSYTNSGTNTVQGLTKPGDVQVSFTSTSLIDGTGGSGYAQITDSTTVDNVAWKDLSIFLTNGGGFTGYEFSVDYGSKDVSKKDPAYLTIEYFLLGNNTTTPDGTFAFNATDPVLVNLAFNNPANTDFRLVADGGDVLGRIELLSSIQMFEEKQNDIQLAPGAALPEPSTWAMMLFGFGAAGVAMRRSRRKTQLMSQLA